MITDLKIHEKIVYQYIYKLINSNMYILTGSDSAVVIDAIISEESVNMLKSKGITQLYILITHEHYDHIQGVNYLRKHFNCCIMGSAYAIEVMEDPTKNLAAYLEPITLFMELEESWREEYQIPADYSCKGDISFKARDVFEWEGICFNIVSTPGHSKGSICISIDDKYYFTGDSLVDGEEIILRLPGGSRGDYKEITRPYLNNIKKDSVILPGHGNIKPVQEFHIV